jgi:hypothetical protein
MKPWKQQGQTKSVYCRIIALKLFLISGCERHF